MILNYHNQFHIEEDCHVRILLYASQKSDLQTHDIAKNFDLPVAVLELRHK
jgi:hypothetical protein